MYNKSLFIGSIVLFLMVLLGCPMSIPISISIEGTPEPEAAAKNLANQINMAYGAETATAASETVTLTKSISVQGTVSPSIQTAPLSDSALSVSRATSGLSSLTIPDGITFKVAVSVTLTIAANGKITVNQTGKIIVAKENSNDGNITVDGGTLDVSGTIEVQGNIEVKTNSTLTVAKTAALSVKGSLTVEKDAAVTVNGTITVEENGSVTGAGSLAGSGTVAGNGIVAVNKGSGLTNNLTSTNADSVKALSEAITAIKQRGTGTVIHLTDAFYTDANNRTSAIVIDANTTRNTSSYTIKGLGKDSTQALNVGIILANDKVTLDGVKFAITDPTKAATTNPTNSSYTNYRYTAAISIGRTANGTAWLAGADLASNNVTVKNCNISYNKAHANNGYSFNAGIYVNGDLTAAAPQSISITDNSVETRGTGTAAAQAVTIAHYDPSMVITGNTLSSYTGSPQAINGPASALFLNINPAKVNSTATPNISGNTLDGHNIDFYANIYSTGDYVGVPALFASKFGTYYSTWVTDTTDSFYRKLYTTLISQAQAAGYAGLFFMALGGEAGSYDGYCFVYEAWEKTGGTVTAVDYWGATILNDRALQYNAGDGTAKYDTDTAADSASGYQGRTPAGYRGRITLNRTAKSYTAFKFNPTDNTPQGAYKYTVGISK